MINFNEIKHGDILYFKRQSFYANKEAKLADKKREREWGEFNPYDEDRGMLIKVVSAASAPVIGHVLFGTNRWGHHLELREEHLKETGGVKRLWKTDFREFPPYYPKCPSCDQIVGRKRTRCRCGFIVMDEGGDGDYEEGQL